MPDFQTYTNIFILALIGLILVVGAALIYRIINSGVRGRKGTRLGVTEYFEIDKKRRLLLVRRDDVEHLVLIGGEHDTVIEIGIPTGLVQSQMMQSEMMQDPGPQLRPSRQSYAPIQGVQPDFIPEDEQR